MSWVGHQKRWTKMYRGRTYSVSCRQLGVPPTKDTSWAAANQWWEVKQAAIDAEARAAEPPPDPTSVAVSQLLAAHGFSHLRDVVMARDRGAAAERILELARAATADGEGLSDSLEAIHAGKPVLPPVPHEELVRIDAMLGPTPGPPAAGRTLKEHVERWIGSLRDRVAGRKMSAGRRDRYERDIRKFMAWSGPGSLVDELTAAKLDGWYSHLCEGLEEGGSTETARHAMMTVRQLITWLAERGTIPLPGNIRSRSHVFGGVVKKVDHFTREEVGAILAAADAFSKRTKLYLLLMLNCGMYQNDLAELLHTEVDWKAGTITRKRSKRKKHEAAQEVCYPLWPETFALLRQFRSEHPERVLVTEDGNPLVRYWFEKEQGSGEEKYRRYDCVQSAWSRLKEEVEVRLDLKHFRKTSAQLLSESARFRHLVGVFLAQAPRGVAARNYLDESRGPQFRRAVAWLGQQFGLEA
jgi:integrase